MDRIRTSSLMMSARKSWLAIGSQDEAFYNAVLSHYAGTYSLATGQGDPMESLVYRMKSIDIVNSRLGEPELGVSDGTIGAVGSLITYEVTMIPVLRITSKYTEYANPGKQW
jgi:hypothetical protein